MQDHSFHFEVDATPREIWPMFWHDRRVVEHGDVRNSVNFPDATMPRESRYRVAIANANVPNMLGQISTAMADANLNIHNMLNKSRGEMAYTLVDVDTPVSDAVLGELRAIGGVLGVRYLPDPQSTER